MASVIIKGDTSGQIELAAPAVAGTNTITLPASTGTILTTTSPKAGNVIQVINSTVGYVTTTSGTYTDTGLTATITPSSSSNKVLVLVNLNGITVTATSTVNFILTNGSNTSIQLLMDYSLTTTLAGVGNANISLLHSPATTSAYTYKVRFAVSGGNTLRLNDYASSQIISTITLLEIAA
jgi:hypothetical protein